MATSVGSIQVDASLNSAKFTAGIASMEATARSATGGISKYLSSISVSLKDVGDRAEKAFSSFKTVSLAGLTAAGAGIVGLAKGFDEASGSQKAYEANMKLAGQSTQETAKTFQLLQDYANKSIYSLTDMTSTAGILASTGVKNSGELVKAFGNMASAADDPAQAIKSISQQMAQVNGKGFVQTMDFRIMQEQASGPMKLVQDQLMALNNWNPKQFQDALSKGAISADMLNKAMLAVGQNQTLNDLATKPQTIGAAWEALTSTFAANMATSQTWANIQSQVINLLTQASDWISNNQKAIEGWVQSAINAVKAGAQWISDNRELLATIAKIAIGMKGAQIAAGGIITAFKAVKPYVAIFKGLGGSVGGLLTKFGPLGIAIGLFVAALSTTKEGQQIFQQIGSAIGQIMSALQPIIPVITNLISQIATALAPVISTILNTVMQIIPVVMPILTQIITAIGQIIVALTPIITFIVNLIATIISTVLPIVSWIFSNIISPIISFITGFISSVVGFIGGLIGTISGIVGGIVGFVSGIISAVVGVVGGIVGTIVGIVGSVIGAIGGIIRGIVGVVTGVVKAITGAFSAGWNAVKSGLSALSNGIKSIFSAIGGFVKAPINGIIGAINGVIKTINGIKVPDWVPGIGGKHTSFPTIPKLASGGYVSGVGTATSDSNLAALSRGEYVINARAVDLIGRSNLDAINQGQLPTTGVQIQQVNNNYSQFDLDSANANLYNRLRTAHA